MIYIWVTRNQEQEQKIKLSGPTTPQVTTSGRPLTTFTLAVNHRRTKPRHRYEPRSLTFGPVSSDQEEERVALKYGSSCRLWEGEFICDSRRWWPLRRWPGGRGVIEEGIYGALMTDADLKEARPIYGPLLSIFLYGMKVLLFYIRMPGRRGNRREEGACQGSPTHWKAAVRKVRLKERRKHTEGEGAC